VTGFNCPIHHDFKVADSVLADQRTKDYGRSEWEAALSKAPPTAAQVCYVENGEGGFTSDLSTSVFFSFFTSFLAFLIAFFASFFCFDFPFAIASSR
jgi:hypothetical protein